jgi:hypothetical protein
LEEAIGLVQRVKSAIGVGSASADVVAKALGHPSIQNGTATRKIGTLTHFGLLDREGGGKYRLSELAKQICTPRSEQEYRDALAESAKSPALYRELIAKYEGQALPTLLPNILNREFGVLEKNAADVSENFRASMEQARLLRNGVLYSSVDDTSDTRSVKHESVSLSNESSSPEHLGAHGPKSASEANDGLPESGSVTRFQILLPGRRTAYLFLPTVVEKSDLERIARWMDFNEDLLTNDKAVDESVDG